MYRLLADHPGEVPDPVPEAVRARRGLPDRRLAIGETHFPPAGTSVDALNRFETSSSGA